MNQPSKRTLVEAAIQQELDKLSSNTGPLGDWKIIKNKEAESYYQALGQEVIYPYDPVELHEARQVIRDKINKLQEILKKLPEDPVYTTEELLERERLGLNT